jgi:hypothetical protein
VDFGAGDGRFARYGEYDEYVGCEIDIERLQHLYPNSKARIENCDAFEFGEADFDLAIGNPPYVRHHEIDKVWLSQIQQRLSASLGVERNFLANMFMYFMLLAVERTHSQGLVALIVPCEWTVRPSYLPLRRLLTRQRWKTEVFFFQDEVFEGVMTTACLALVDKSKVADELICYNVDRNFTVTHRGGPTGSGFGQLNYDKRGPNWAMRGLSPGSQKVFTLTEGERIHHGLTLDDVVPCVTSLKSLQHSFKDLSADLFEKNYIQQGRRCWLVRADKEISSRVHQYYDSVSQMDRDTSTCRKRTVWFEYQMPKVPAILFSTGFVDFGPKLVCNTVGAVPVGSVAGIHVFGSTPVSSLMEGLASVDFEKRLVAHSNGLKKIEIGQMNSVLNALASTEVH